MTKNVYENTEALCHAYVYADENAYGHNRSNSCHFNGNNFYSYETKVCIKYPKKRIAIIDSDWYSTTTSSQLRTLKRAFSNEWTILYYPEIDIKKIPAHIKETIKNLTKKHLHKQNDDGIFKIKLDRLICNNIKQIIDANIVKVPQSIKDLVDKNVKFELDRTQKIKKQQEERYQQRLKAEKEDNQRFIDCFIKEKQSYLDNYKKQLYDGKITLSAVIPILNDLFNNFCHNNGDLFTKYVKIINVRNYIYEQIFGTISNSKEIFGYDIHPDVVWVQDGNKIVTNRYVNFTLTKETLEQFKKFAKYYLKCPTDGKLVDKHVHCYRIGKYNSEYVCIGCHIFTYKNIELLCRELETLNVG